MNSNTIASVVDLGSFIFLLFVLDWNFLPAFGVSVLLGMAVKMLLNR